MPGPVPNREADLARPRERKGSDAVPVTKGVARPVTIPHADKDWHPIAKRFWDALKSSGQSDFFQNTDWAFAFSLCDDLSYYKKPLKDREGKEYHKRSPEMLKAIYSGMERLLVTEADRRRLRLELHDPEDDEREPASVTAIADYKRNLGVVRG